MDEVKEGFLCPICVTDLGTAVRLQSHFDEAHSIEAEDGTKAGQNIKGMLDKAKRKILRKAGEGNEYDGDIEIRHSGSEDTEFFHWEPQDIGYCRDWTREFRKLRSETVDDGMIEINTILIRLEKIMKASSDAKDSRNSAKKATERSLVPWASDSEAKLCFVCKKSFTVARRKHHCRLCGKVICGKCSEFLPSIFAEALCKLDGISNPQIEAKCETSTDELDSLRVCSTCDGLLVRHYESWKEKQKKIPLVKLYEKMTSLMTEADLLLPDFNKMAESLSFGDTRYSYQEVLDLRMKLLKIYETLEVLSKKVVALGTNNNDENKQKIGVQTLKLQRGVHGFVLNYLQTNMFTLRSIPSEQEYEHLQTERLALLRKRAEREKQQQERAMKERAMIHKEALRRERDSKTNSPALGRKHGPEEHHEQHSLASDALLEQIENVKGYLRTAREREDFEKIPALELNLNELQIEYNKMTNR